MMASSASKAPRYSFGPFELDTAEARLYRNGVRVPLQDLPYRLLALLVEHAGDVLTREELQRHLWPANTFVEFDNSLGVAVRKVRDALHDSAEEPRYLETIPKRGYRFLGRVENLGLAPPQIQSQPEFLPGRDPEIEPHVLATGGRRFHPVYWLLIGIIVLSAGAAFYFSREKPKASDAALPSAQPVRVRRSIALLGFRNLRGRPEDNWLSAAFSEMLSTELAAGGELRMVSGEDVSRAKNELPLKDEDTLAKATLQRLRADPGADLVVLGSYTPLPGNGAERIRLDLRVQDTNTGETAAEDSVMGDEDDLFQLVSDAGVRLRSALGVSSLTAQGTAGVRVSLPSNKSALRWYTAGQARLWEFDFAGGRDLLLKAIAAEPDYSPSHAALAEAWSHLGYGAKALREAQKAVDLSQQLPEEERFIIQGQYLEVSSQWPRAVGTYTVLFQRFPDSLEYGLRLASAQRHVNSADALKTLSALRNLPSPIGNDPRIDMAEASTLVNEDLVRAHAAIERAIAKGTAQGSHLLVARAYGIMCQLSSVPQTITTAEVINACESARQSYAAARDRNNEARTLNDFAGLSFRDGDLVRAQSQWREAALEFRQVDDIEGLAASSNNLADVAILEGNLGDGKKFLQQALPNYEALGDKDGVARVFNDLGVILLQSGDLHAAETKFQQAKEKADEINDSDVQADAAFGMGDIALAHGDLANSRTAYQNALKLRNAIGEKQAIAESQLAIARLTLEEGHAAEAEATARRCRDQFRQEQQKDDELDAAAVLVRALLAEQKHVEAQKELAEETALAETSHNLSLRLQYRLVSAQADSATKQLENARTLLDAVLREAKAHNLAQPQYEAQLAVAELEKLSGHTAVANDQFTKLEKSARAGGYELIARKASAGRS